MMNKYLVIVLGPTGIGKTDTSIRLAKHFQTEIISADSRQFYREMRIGTAMPGQEQLEAVTHHFVGSLSVTDYYNVHRFETAVLELLADRYREKDLVIMTGGSGLYIDVVCRGIDDFPDVDPRTRKKVQGIYAAGGIEGIRTELQRIDPVYYDSVDLNNPNRIMKALEVAFITGKPYSSFLKRPGKKRPFHVIKTGLRCAREELYERINRRVDSMMGSGLLEEAKSLLPYRDTNALNTVGYKEIFSYLDGEISLDKAVELIKRNTRRYARRQLTWFRKDKDITWFDSGETQEMIRYIEARMASTNKETGP